MRKKFVANALILGVMGYLLIACQRNSSTEPVSPALTSQTTQTPFKTLSIQWVGSSNNQTGVIWFQNTLTGQCFLASNYGGLLIVNCPPTQ